MGTTVASIEPNWVTLDSGRRIASDLAVIGVGVAPRTELAEQAGLDVDDGVLVDDHLATSATGIWAAGDIARWPDRHCGRRIRVEHWVVAQRQGRTAALNMLGRDVCFAGVPFFWTTQFGVTVGYVGHAPGGSQVEVRGNLSDDDALAGYRCDGRIVALAGIGRDRQLLEAAVAMERRDEEALEALLA
jgi:NADPH-dependent 2,4-dienoyl-CoA reductase/sulfur reductase-like enzyme